MNRTLTLLCSAAVALTATLPGLASATEFQITLPVEFRNLPPTVTAIGVRCNVLNHNRTRTLAFGFRPVKLSGGNYIGPVVIQATADQVMPKPTAADFEQHLNWSCFLYDAKDPLQVSIQSKSDAQNSHYKADYAVAPGAPFVPEVSGIYQHPR